MRTLSLPRNVGSPERILMALAGAGLFALAVKMPRLRRPFRVASTALLLRSATGYCPGYAAVGVPDRRFDTKGVLGGPRGELVDAHIVIERSPADVYAFWRDVNQLAQALPAIIQVEPAGGEESRWTLLRGEMSPARWTASVINDEPGRLIAWKTVDDADVVSAGSVHFKEVAGGQGTHVHVRFQHSPPFGRVGASLASVFGRDARTVVQQTLESVRRFLESRPDTG
jgi:uncharacterized membrane protein